MVRFPSKAHIILAAALALAAPVAAQTQPQPESQQQPASGSWSLQRCIDHALQNNLQIRQSQVNARQNKIAENQARAAMLPTANASASQGYNYGYSIDPFTNTFTSEQIRSNNFSASSVLTIFNGLQLQRSIQQSRLNFEAGMNDVEKAKNDVILNITAAYLQILFNEELLQTSQLLLNNTKAQAERTEKLYRAGSVAENSLLEVQAQQATDELNVINAQNQRNLAVLNLIQLLDLQNQTDLQIERPELPDPADEPIVYNAESVFATAENIMPEVKSVDLRVQSAIKGLQVARGAYYPRLTLSGAIFTGYSSARSLFTITGQQLVPVGFVNGDQNQPVLTSVPIRATAPYAFKDQLSDNLGKSVNLNLNIPILNGLQARTGVQRARLNLESAELNARITRNQLRQAIQQAHADALAAQQKYMATRKQLTATEKSFKNAEVRFSAGVMNTTDYNVAANNYRRSQSDLLQAKYDFIFKQKILDFYQGKPLSF